MKHEAIAASLNSSGNAPQAGELAEGLTITENEAEQIERANASSARPVVFVYGHLAAALKLEPLGDAVRGGRIRGVNTELA
jgi:hypothetical protein